METVILGFQEQFGPIMAEGRASAISDNHVSTGFRKDSCPAWPNFREHLGFLFEYKGFLGLN